jgi:hypothetical protein
VAVSRFVDEHEVEVAASPEAVWRALGRQLRGWRRPAEVYAFAVGARPWQRSGDPLATGGTIPGFTVEEAVPGQLLRLGGRHHFSAYTLTFTLAPSDGRTTLTAHTDAHFPGPHGRLYRAVVVDSGAHRTFVRRMLRAIGRSADRAG